MEYQIEKEKRKINQYVGYTTSQDSLPAITQQFREQEIYKRRINNLKQDLENKDTLFGKPILHISKYYVVLQYEHYRLCYDYHDILTKLDEQKLAKEQIKQLKGEK